MNKINMSLTVFVLLLLLNMTRGQYSRSCNSCDDPTSGATWSQTTTNGACHGQCDIARRNITKICIFFNNQTIVCNFVLPCTNEMSCDGTWGPWSNHGNCNSTCGPGFQRQSRACYKRVLYEDPINPRFRTSNLCLKGKGVPVQDRIVSCNRVQCSRTKLYTKITTQPFTIKQDGIVSTDEYRTITNAADRSGDKARLEKSQTNSSNKGIDILTLAAVLGTIAVLCVLTVSVVVIVIKRKKAQILKATSATSSSNRLKKENNVETDQYEMIGPILPRNRCVSERRFPNNRITQNILYNQYPSDNALNLNRNDSLGVYLQPVLTPSISMNEVEAVQSNDPTYACIDDYMY